MQSFSEKHAMALAYAEAGIPVIAIEENGKRPVTKNGLHDATTDIEEINRLWKKNHEYNLAICPASINIFVLDLDPGADMGVLRQYPTTYTVRTPRGGVHAYFEGVGPSTAGKLGPHIDTRSIGGYVLVPPSVINGKKYEVLNDCDYALLPSEIIDKLAAVDTPVAAATEEKDIPGNIERARRALLSYVQRGDVAIEGRGGDDRTYRLCCELLDLGLSVGKAMELVEEIWNPHCQPPWMPEELEAKFENASYYQQNEAGAYAVGNTQEAFAVAFKNLKLDSLPEKRSRFHFKDESEQDDEPDPKWIIKDLISERSTVMMFGASGSYKSFLALDICLSVATGLPAFGSETTPGLVFYGALEGKAHLKKARRAWRILKGVEGKIENFFVGMAPMIGIENEVQEFGDEITRRCNGRKPALIVIDTLSKSMAGMNENDAADAGKFIRFCDSLVETFGCTVIAIHHNGKEEQRGARGSSAFQAGFDTVLEVKAHKHSKAVAVYVRKHKDAEEREAPWTFEGRITGPSLTFEATTPEQHRLLAGESKDVTPKTVGAALKALKAVGEGASVSTAVLATEITPARENESMEDRAISIARTGRVLASEAKNALEAYCVKRGRELLWHLPMPA